MVTGAKEEMGDSSLIGSQCWKGNKSSGEDTLPEEALSEGISYICFPQHGT